MSCQQVVLSPKQLNMTSLQVEILEKEIAELKAALQEAKTKNVHLTGIVEEQKRCCYTYCYVYNNFAQSHYS